MYAEVALPLPLRRTFHYAVPESLRPALRPGSRVRVPFGQRRLSGVCVALAEAPPPGVLPEALRPIERLLDENAPALPEPLLELARFVAHYYRSSWGEALAAALPGSMKTRRRRAAGAPAGPAAAAGEEAPAEGRTEAKEARASEGALAPEDAAAFTLTPGQARAVETISALLERERFAVVLLHGITGSGKTEVYLRAIEGALSRGKSALVLVPEIALTPQTIERFRRRVPHCGVLHSMQSPAERARAWERAASGRTPVVVGPRSAVFAPLSRLGLVVVDEEHETSFKQEAQDPRYHARDLAIVRARNEGAIAILGSATPSLESYENARRGRYLLLTLDARATGAPLPEVEVVDLREEVRARRDFPFISRRLETALAEALGRGEQAILFLNRRGFSTFLRCRQCGHVLTCGECAVALAYHKERERACCHYCEKRLDPPRECPACRSPAVQYFGFGTERIAEEVARRFPAARVRRVDSDAIASEEDLRSAFDAFRRGEAQVLVGTQMVGKGLDFPNVTLAGVISADTALNFPDFRASERTFQLLAQVAGRAGRGARAGRTIIQTFAPEHPAVRAAATHDAAGFFEQELAHRRKLGYPPFGRLALAIASALGWWLARRDAGLSHDAAPPGREEVRGPEPIAPPPLGSRAKSSGTRFRPWWGAAT